MNARTNPDTMVRDVIQEWDFTRLRQYLEREGTDDIDAKLREYKRFMELNARFPELRFPMSAPIDDVWHAHILDTPNYRRFCDEAIGFFVEHRPCLGEAELNEMMPDYLANTIGRYREIFLIEAPKAYWPPECVCKCCGT